MAKNSKKKNFKKKSGNRSFRRRVSKMKRRARAQVFEKRVKNVLNKNSDQKYSETR